MGLSEAARIGNLKKTDFTLEYVLEVLVRARQLTNEQARTVLAKEAVTRTRILAAVGTSEQAARYDISPIELVAVWNFPRADGRAGGLDQDLISEWVAKDAGISYRKIDPLTLDMGLATRTLSKPFANKHVILPLQRIGATLVVAVANPFDTELFATLSSQVGTHIEPVLCSKMDILKSIADIYGFKRTLAKAADDFGGSSSINNFEQLVSLSSNQELEASDRPVVQAVDYLLRYAFEQRASDIHIEPKRDSSFVRFRIDGVLHNVHQLPQAIHAPVASRLKMLSRMDISEKRKPQDGRIKTEREGREVELRVSTLPTVFGEKVVVRIFDPDAFVQELAHLGFEANEKATFEQWIARPHGLILVTGPTGSGKTTTLYSALKAVSGPDVNVTTIEDPIEMVCDAFNQVQVQPKIGLDFSGALRHILRQDPDVIMVGEIRDAETAENAIQAALTGHLVLSTLHTNDALGAVERLRDLGTPPFLLSAALVGVLAQRLVRKVCSHCAVEASLSSEDIQRLAAPLPLLPSGLKLLKGKGCVRCRETGYFGRAAIFEMLNVDREMKELILKESSKEIMLAHARKSGLRNLREAAIKRMAQGMTTYDEVMRMTSVD